jgi:hypothetical protein
MRLPFVIAIVLVVLVGCVPESRPTETPDSATPSSSAASPTEASASPDASVSIEPSIEPLVTPTPSASASPPIASPSGSVEPGAADACSGSDQNRDFFRDAAKALDWTVYCAKLPSGWFVESGEYRRAGGGRLEISYKGPGGARFELHEGAFCSSADGCVPSGIEVGEAQLGDQTGTLRATDVGGWALVVDGDGTISWLAIGSGMDENAFRGLAAAAVAVSG